MPYISVNFKSLSQVNERDFWNVYNTPLLEQFDILQKRHRELRHIHNFEEFALIAFAVDELRTYHISLPNYERSFSEKNGRKYLNNVIIRTHLSPANLGLPFASLEPIFIGSIVISDRDTIFEVKGLDFLDSSLIPVGEMSIKAYTKVIFDYSNIHTTVYYDGINAFSPEFIDDLRFHCYPVRNPSVVHRMYQDWNQYLDFIEDYQLSKKKDYFSISSNLLLDTYVIGKTDFIENKEYYSSFVLDKDITDKFWKGDEVIVSEKSDNSAEFPLIRVQIDVFQKEYSGDNSHLEKKFIKQLSRFTNENVCISSTKPNYANQSDYTRQLNDSIRLGDRYAIVPSIIVEPSYDELNRLEREEIKKTEKEIQDWFESAASARSTQEAQTPYKKTISDIHQKYNQISEADNNDINEKIDNFEDLLNDELLKAKVEYERNREEIFIRIMKESNLDLLQKKTQARNEITSTFDGKRAELKANQTLLRYYLYFKFDDKRDYIASNDEAYLIFDETATKTKMERSRNALKMFYQGYVKNPFLSSYLFEPENMEISPIQIKEPEWFTTRLNPEQKDAIMKALSSNSLFLLQGPPGTGKTEVIAELVAQFTKIGKKVMVSSETHKAIDNVFNRLPKTAHIRPIRLIPDKKSNKDRSDREQMYGPGKLLPNFYRSITENMETSLKRYRQFTEDSQYFENEIDSLAKSINVYQTNHEEVLQINDRIQKNQDSLSEIKNTIASNKGELSQYIETIAKLKNTKMELTNNKFTSRITSEADADDTIDDNTIIACQNEMLELLKTSNCFQSNDEGLRMVLQSGQDTVYEKFSKSAISPSLSRDLAQIAEIDSKISRYMKQEISISDSELISLRNQYADLQKNVKNTYLSFDPWLSKVFSSSYLSEKPNAKQASNDFQIMKDKLLEVRSKWIRSVNETIGNVESYKNRIQLKIDTLHQSEEQLSESLTADQNIPMLVESLRLEESIKLHLEKYFAKVATPPEYDNYSHALSIIKNQWSRIKDDQYKKIKAIQKNVPLFERIVRYLNNPDVIEHDKLEYSKPLFEAGNLFGLTCTSSDRYNANNNSDLRSYGLEEIQMKRVGIDVVIIDEVSKSSLLELIIPILYGKTVILVGDHRQLPPMYEYKYLKATDFEGLNPDISTIELNRYYQEMYETSFFKTLFENAPQAFKATLLKQYRSHSHIMNVFNHFYQGKLQLGFPGQDNIKAHHLRVTSKGLELISPEKSTYFVDCVEKESSDFTETTSCSNQNEADVAVKIVRAIEQQLKRKVKDDSNFPLPSIGIICTYGDQAKNIKKKIPWLYNSNYFNKETEQRPIISTVDDFQGDERDIIIVSMVRNPRDPSKTKADFIKAFERINVAYSRARKLLIILGSKEYLSVYGKIDLPDMDGIRENNKTNYPVFQKIINTIASEGRILNDKDFVD